MENVITVGKRLLPVEQIALVEPFDPTSNPDFKPEKQFKARVATGRVFYVLITALGRTRR